MIKNIFTRPLLVVAILSFPLLAKAQNAMFWKSHEGKASFSQNDRTIIPNQYKAYALDRNEIHKFLSGLQEGYEYGKQLVLPSPDGSFKTFNVWRTSTIAPELTAKYPELQTFTAEEVGNESVTAKISYTYLGFKAMIYDRSANYAIDPFSNQDNGYFMVYYTNDYPTTSAKEVSDFVTASYDLTPGSPTIIDNHDQSIAQRTHGNDRRIYRLALSCTGEWAVAVAGANPTKAHVLSVMVESVNRANGILEKEIAVTLNIIAGNDNITYTNPGADPFECNNDVLCLVDENQENIDEVVGSVNYDIGHVFSTSGGGLSQLASVCRNSSKASSTSSISGPSNISGFVHEVGRQLGASRTFSVETGNCFEKLESASAYEPGSGTTIMSYSGLCSPNNITDEVERSYFHVHSLLQISSFIARNSNCGAPHGGMPGVVLSNVTDSFNIPGGTPIELVAPIATTTQKDAILYYNWEQYDLAGQENASEESNPDASSGPLFRSFPPDTSRYVSYPALEHVLEGKLSTISGQRVPKVDRIINFKLTARSVYQGWGSFNVIDSTLKLFVSGGAGPFSVTSQNSAETWEPGDEVEIKWDVANTDKEPVNCGYVNIYMSIDGGKTFAYNIVSNAPNNGSYSYKIPNLKVSDARIKIKGSGSVFYNVNKGKITINGDELNIDKHLFQHTVEVYPNPATHILYVENKNNTYRNLKIALYNIMGQKVYESVLQDKLNIDVAQFAKGNYLMQIIEEEKGLKSTQKVVLK